MSELMTKHEMTEEDIKLQYITPAIERAGWNKLKQIKMEYNFTDGRVIVRGNVTARGKKKRTDYLLYYKPNIPLAIIEAKDNKHSVGAGMQQAIEYAEVLDIPFVSSSNGDGFLEHDMKSGKERELTLEQFPSPQDLWRRHIGDKHFTPEQEELITEPYYFQPGDKTPRYYQRIAINRTIDAIARGQNRILLVMATGTGKTYTAFQIIHRLWKSGRKKKGFIENLVVFYLENSGHKITLYTKRWFALANHFFLCYNIFRYFSIFGGFLLTLNQYLL